MRKVIVLGALSAIAEATCRRLAEQGASLALFGRDRERLTAVAADLRVRGAAAASIHAGDLADASGADAQLAAASAELGGADAVMLFYGVLGDQARAEAEPGHAAEILAVNFTSAALWMLAARRLLARRQDSTPQSLLLAISSVAGDRGRRSNYVYGAAKGGLSVLMQGIAHEGGGVRAVTMKLGFVDTPMTAAIKKGGPLWANPAQVADAILRAMDRGGPIVYAPWFWRWIMLAIRATPDVLFNRVNL